MTNKVMLIILDGFGINKEIPGNAVLAAQTPFLQALQTKYPHCRLKTSGKYVGLPDGIMGNSEVGHLNIGAGRVVYQLNTLIDHKIETGEFFQNPALLAAINHARRNNSKLHLFGLLSDGGVHSSLLHLEALLNLCAQQKFHDVFFHAFMDGRDTLPEDGLGFMQTYLAMTEKFGLGKVASISGRYYAMDRDQNWTRIQKAYDALVYGKGLTSENPLAAIQNSYRTSFLDEKGQTKYLTDEFILPTVITNNQQPLALVQDHDAIIFFNFRSDRPRELTKAFIEQDFNEFPHEKFTQLKYVTMAEYDACFNHAVDVAFRLEKLEQILGQVLAENQKSQLRLAETEKYAHVTFFFNGGGEEPFPQEERILIPSPKVSSYDLQPEMSAYLVTEKAIEALQNKNYDAIIINFANCDMVGHTGVFSAVVKAVETVDHCLSKIVPLAQAKHYQLIITADHGNAEQMLDEEGNIMTAHSKNEVPCLLLTDKKNVLLNEGSLCDLAPTLLHLMGIEQPQAMTGKNLIRTDHTPSDPPCARG